jgi:2-polyprenyl-3-methyl-5-hydroxy-6-metoxy-1,4-benzoquinol methylase
MTAASDVQTRDHLTPELIEALTTGSGADFCRFLRRVYFEELRTGHVAEAAAAEPALAARAHSLHLLRPDRAGARLTDVGYEVSNVAKEYANWLDGGRKLPDGVPASILDGQRVLDVGCSFGRQMIAFAQHGARVWGIDFQTTYLRLSSAFARQQGLSRLRVARARAEQLPFLPGSFDVVFCRLVLNYVADVDGTIAEFSRVLKPGGTLVLIIEPLGAPVRSLLKSKWLGNTRTIAFILFGLLNTVIVELGGRQLVLRRQGRMHTQHSPVWPTGRWLTRHLAAQGFSPLQGATLRDPHRPELFLGVVRSLRA